MSKNIISGQVFMIENNEEIFVGSLQVYSPPRVGECIRFLDKRNGHQVWTVENITHNVGDGVHNYPEGFQSIFIYAKPMVQEER